MRPKKTTRSGLIIANLIEIMINKKIREKAIFRIYGNGSMFYVLNGKEIPKIEFENKYPINYLPIRFHGENPDKTKII